MIEPLTPAPTSPRRWLPLAGVALLLSGLLVGVAVARLTAPGSLVSVSLPPASSSALVVRPSPHVLQAMRDLARLESASFRMERVVDATEKQSSLFGLLQADDALLLVASAEISAGVDLSSLGPGDVTIDPIARRARVSLPPAEIFHTELDNQRTFVHSRRTDLLAKRNEGLEGRARAEAERALGDAAREAGILRRAEASAAKTVEALVRSLGYTDVEVRVRPGKLSRAAVSLLHQQPRGFSLLRSMMIRARASDQGESQALRDELRNAGLRATPSRVTVLRLLRGSDAPVSHSEVSETLESSGWDRATLYRNLLDLTRVGLARRTDVGDHVWRFEAVTAKGHRTEEHPHFVCNQCGTIECLDGLTVVSGPGRKTPKALRRNAVEIQLKGLCDRCFLPPCGASAHLSAPTRPRGAGAHLSLR